MARSSFTLEELVSFRQSATYSETLGWFDLTPVRFFRRIKEAYAEGLIQESDIAELLEIEKRTLRQYHNEILRGQRKKFPEGTSFNRRNVATLIEITLEKIAGYSQASREKKIKLLRKKFIKYQSPSGKEGVYMFFRDHKIGSVLNYSPPFVKRGSPGEAIRLYDDVMKLGLFDRSKKDYLGRWEIYERCRWENDIEGILTVEAIEEVLWRIPGYRHASRKRKIDIIRQEVIRTGAVHFFEKYSLAGMLQKSPCLDKKDSPAAAFRFYDKGRGLGLFDRTEKEYLGRWEFGEQGMWRDDTDGILTAEAIEDVLWRIPGYRHASRERKIEIIRQEVIRTGAMRFFRQHHLLGMLGNSPHLSKLDSPAEALRFYNSERDVGLFDRSKKEYLRRWEIREMNMWQGNRGLELAVEAVEDVLWSLPGYRYASRDEKVKIVRKKVLHYKSQKGNGARRFFCYYGLSGMLDQSPHISKSSPEDALRLYDKNRGVGLFNSSYEDYIKDKELPRRRA